MTWGIQSAYRIVKASKLFAGKEYFFEYPVVFLGKVPNNTTLHLQYGGIVDQVGSGCVITNYATPYDTHATPCYQLPTEAMPSDDFEETGTPDIISRLVGKYSNGLYILGLSPKPAPAIDCTFTSYAGIWSNLPLNRCMISAAQTLCLTGPAVYDSSITYSATDDSDLVMINRILHRDMGLEQPLDSDSPLVETRAQRKINLLAEKVLINSGNIASVQPAPGTAPTLYTGKPAHELSDGGPSSLWGDIRPTAEAPADYLAAINAPANLIYFLWLQAQQNRLQAGTKPKEAHQPFDAEIAERYYLPSGPKVPLERAPQQPHKSFVGKVESACGVKVWPHIPTPYYSR